MEIFLVLLLKLIPLYLVIILGYISAKYLDIDKQSIARLLLYVVAPVVIFLGVYKAELSTATLSLPFLFFVIASCIGLLCYFIVGKIYPKGNTLKNILAFAAGSGNTGYFGIPVVFILFGEEMFSLAILANIGLIIYENTVGFFLVARGNFSMKSSLLRIAKLPNIYAIILGFIFNIIGIEIFSEFLLGLENFKGSYSVIAMMLIGMGLVGVRMKNMDWIFTSGAFISKFIAWPLLVGLIIYLDMHYMSLYNSEIYRLMFLMSIVPMAANTIVLAVEFQNRPKMVTLNILLSTLLAIIIIPLSVIFIFPLFK